MICNSRLPKVPFCQPTRPATKMAMNSIARVMAGFRPARQSPAGQVSPPDRSARWMTARKSGDPTTLNRLYGRSKGKALRVGQQALVDELLPQIAVPADGPVTAERLFGHDCPLHFEIGFGGGEHLAARADMLPDHGFIGCEPFLNGVAQALGHIRDERLANV